MVRQKLKSMYLRKYILERDMGLRSYIIKRLVYSFALVIIIIIINFAIFKAMPGDPVSFLMQAWSKENPAVRRQQEALIRSIWGLGEPIHIQLVKYIRNLFTWELGVTIINKEPISSAIARKAPYTLMLIGGATAISIVIGIILGIYAIRKRGGFVDSTLVTSSLVMGSLPTFWLGLVFLYVFYSWLGWFPNTGATPVQWAITRPIPWLCETVSSENALSILLSFNMSDVWVFISGYMMHVFLPMLTLIVFFVGSWILLTRATMLETITEDYIVTARAKGLTEHAVLFKHALKNASLPIITSAAISFGFVLTGAIITETVFTYPGLGGWTWTAIQFLDYPVLMAIFYIVSLCVIMANIIADLLYGVIDPRIKVG